MYAIRSYYDDPKLPDPVQPPRDPKEIETVEELYLTGIRVRQIYNPGVDPAAYFDEALRRDPGDTRTNRSFEKTFSPMTIASSTIRPSTTIRPKSEIRLISYNFV